MNNSQERSLELLLAKNFHGVVVANIMGKVIVGSGITMPLFTP